MLHNVLIFLQFGCKVSANRRQNKEKFSFFVEMQPNFTERSDVKLVQMSGKTKFIFLFISE